MTWGIMRASPWRHIGGRIFLSFTVLLVAVALLFSAAGLQFADKSLRNNAENELRLLSIVLSRQVQRQLSRIEMNLMALENHGFLVNELRKTEPDRAAIEDFLQKRLQVLPLIDDLIVYNRQGICVGATDPSWYDVPARQQPFYINGLKAFGFSDIFSPEDGKIQLASTPINNGTGTKGVIVGQVNMSTIYDLLDQKLGVANSTDAFIIDSNSQFITFGHQGDRNAVQSHLGTTPLVKHLKDEFWVDRYRNYSGREVLGTVFKVPNRHWYIVVERDLAEINRPINNAKKAILAGAGIFVIVLIFVTYFLTKSITSPLMTLIAGAQRVATGDFRQPFMIPKGIDEVAFLAEEFDRMRAKVAAFQEQMLEKLEESERRRLENERLAAIGTLASTLAHEIRNPLNAMSLLLARLELVRVGADLRLTESPIVRDLKREIARLDRLVSDILDYARPLHLNFELVDLVALVESTLLLYRGLFDGRNIRYSTRIPPNPVWLRLDPDRIKQCLVNLLQNAVDAMNGGGHLEVELRQSDQNWELGIFDDGVGLPAQAEGRVFDLFFTTKDAGTGLGLSTVKKIMDAHQGYVTIAPRPPDPSGKRRQGTVVWLGGPANSYI